MIRTCQRISIVLGLSVVMVCGLVTGASAEGPQAAVTVAPGSLTIMSDVPYDKATVRVTGPNGYLVEETYRETPITVDLLASRSLATDGVASNRPSDSPAAHAEASSTLPDGRYRYEVIFYADGERTGVSDGLFFAENGAAVSRDAIRSKFAEVREDLAAAAQPAEGADPAALAENDWIAIVDATDDGITYLSLDSDSPVGNQYWEVVNNLGDLQIVEDTNFTPPGIVRMHFDRGGNVGIGTTAPASALHVEGFNNLRMVDFRWTVDPVSAFFRGPSGNSPFQVMDAPSNSLSIDVEGDVGIGINSFTGSDAPLHVRRGDGRAKVLVQETAGPVQARELFKLENNGGPFFVFTNTDLPSSFSFSHATTVTDFLISHQQTPGVQLRLQGDGDLIIAGTLTQGSSRDVKDGIEPVDSREILAKVAELPVATWKYKGAKDSDRHLGPMAEDFQRVFGLSDDDKHLAPADVAGVALAGIQALQAENHELRQLNDDLASRLAALEKIVLEQSATE